MSTLFADARRIASHGWQSVCKGVAAKFLRPRPVRDHLRTLVLLTLLPLSIFAAFALWRVVEAERSQYQQQLRHVASDLADDIDRTIDGMIVTLRTLATSDHILSGRFTDFHTQASAALTGSPFGAILIDPSRQVLVNTLVPHGTPLPLSADADTPERVLKSKQPQVSNLFVGAALKRPFLNVDVPVLVDGEVRYILLLAFEPTYIHNVLLGQNLQPGWVTGVSDANGAIIARSVDQERYVNTRLPDELFNRRGNERVFIAKNLEGVPVLRAVARLRHANWMTATTVPLSIVEAASRRAFLTFGLLALLALALSLTAATTLGRLLSQSILDLEMVGRAIKHGETIRHRPMMLTEAETVHSALDEAHRARQLVTDELRLTNERLALAARIAGVASATIIYAEGKEPQVKLSPDLAALLGLPGECTLESDMAIALIHPDDRERLAAEFAIATAPDGDGRFQAEHRALKADGSVLWLNVRSTTFFEGAGNSRRPRLTVVAVRDVSARKAIDENLRESHSRYSAALLVGRIASWETNLVTRQRLWTPEGAALFGLELPGLVGRVGGPDDEYCNALHPDDRHLMEHFHQKAEVDDEFGAEYRIQRGDGTVLWVSGRGQVIERDRAGKPVRMLSVVADITQRKRAEEFLTTSETRFRMLAEALPNIAWTATLDGHVDWHSPRWIEYAGSNSHVPAERVWSRHLHPDDLATTRAAWKSAVANLQTYELEHRMRGKDGVYRWFLSRAVPVRSNSDKVTAWVGTATDIEALKQSEARLARYVAVADAANDALISITPDGVIETWNTGAERLFGYSAAEAISQPTTILVPDDALVAHQELIMAVSRQGIIVGPIDVKRRHKSGRIVDVAISMTGVKDDDGRTLAIAKIAHDISDRIEADRRQRLLNYELAHRVKNSFAVLQAVMRATLRSASDLKAFEVAFSGRMQSMASAQEILTDREWRDAELSALAQRQLASHAAARRIEINGSPVHLPAEFAVPLGLVLHELATNAVKYGALSVPQGRVELTWSISATETVSELNICWTELGGPQVETPERRGFGTVLIEQGMPSAKVTRDFKKAGLICTIVIPLAPASDNTGQSASSILKRGSAAPLD